ncbi:MAG: hypothetical protein ACRDHL_12210, partial [Candidatus Promineifilaceae bacterium]
MTAGAAEGDAGAPAGSMRPRAVLLIAVLALIVAGLYSALALRTAGPGYPLDDAWIHQTYARNLAAEGRLSYGPAGASAGSTSPLYTVLLAAGYRLGLPHNIWSLALGWLALAGLGLAGAHLWGRLWPKAAGASFAAGAILVLSWQFVWAAGSGMETLLFTALAVEVLARRAGPEAAKQGGLFVTGLLAGLLVLARPDGLALLALAAA